LSLDDNRLLDPVKHSPAIEAAQFRCSVAYKPLLERLQTGAGDTVVILVFKELKFLKNLPPGLGCSTHL
jgi:hypothetical protein